MCKSEISNKASLTTEINDILNDFGDFDNHYNPFGIFIHTNKHIISIYLGTNCDSYYAEQCNTTKCIGRGWDSEKCPHINNDYSCREDSEDDLEDMIEELLSKGFKYMFCESYFDKNGQRIV